LEDANRVYSWFARSVMVFERIAPLSCGTRHVGKRTAVRV
jgi:hypothetical protein